MLFEAGQIGEARCLLRESGILLDGSLLGYDSHQASQLIAAAFLAYREGNRCDSLEHLRNALALAKEGNRKFMLRYLETTMLPMFCLALENGIEIELVRQIIRDFRVKPPPVAPDLWPWPLRVRTLGRFDVLLDDKLLTYTHKVPRKTPTLMKALIAHNGREVPEQHLCDALWGDDEVDAARESLRITVIGLRKLLGVTESIIQQGGKVSLNQSVC